eukprot:2911728-Amphidinium_carterae.1
MMLVTVTTVRCVGHGHLVPSGEAIVFDDSFEHEVWNDAPDEDCSVKILWQATEPPECGDSSDKLVAEIQDVR